MRDLIPVRTYEVPRGYTGMTYIRRGDAITDRAKACTQLGAAFSIELLSTGEASITCTYQDSDIAIELTPNKPNSVYSSLDKVIEAAWHYIKQDIKETVDESAPEPPRSNS